MWGWCGVGGGGWGVFFFKQKTAYEIGTGDWSSDVCSSDLALMEIDFNTRLKTNFVYRILYKIKSFPIICKIMPPHRYN